MNAVLWSEPMLVRLAAHTLRCLRKGTNVAIVGLSAARRFAQLAGAQWRCAHGCRGGINACVSWRKTCSSGSVRVFEKLTVASPGRMTRAFADAPPGSVCQLQPVVQYARPAVRHRALTATSSKACSVSPTTLTARCHATARDAVRIAVGFYGFAGRSLGHTAPGIESGLLAPLRRVSALDVFVHAMTAVAIETKHFVSEHTPGGAQCIGFVELLAPCTYEAADQAEVDKKYDLPARVEGTRARSEGVLHRYNDGPTLLNIYRSRYSLSRVGKLIAAREVRAGFRYHFVVAARPDSSFTSAVPFNLGSLAEADIWVPDFAHGHVSIQPDNTLVGGGVSDRFALGRRDAMLGAYLTQWEQQLNGSGAWLVDSEHLLCQHLARHDLRIG